MSDIIRRNVPIRIKVDPHFQECAQEAKRLQWSPTIEIILQDIAERTGIDQGMCSQAFEALLTKHNLTSPVHTAERLHYFLLVDVQPRRFIVTQFKKLVKSIQNGPQPAKNEWYYWMRNRHASYIIFRNRDDKVADAKIFQQGDAFQWRVTGPCWSTYDESGTSLSLEEARAECDQRVMKLIEHELKAEFVNPMG